MHETTLQTFGEISGIAKILAFCLYILDEIQLFSEKIFGIPIKFLLKAITQSVRAKEMFVNMERL